MNPEERFAERVGKYEERLRTLQHDAPERLVHGGGGGYIGGMDDAWRTKVDGRLDGLEKNVESVKGSVDGVKNSIDGVKTALTVSVSAAALCFTVFAGASYFMINSVASRVDRIEAKVDAIVPRMTEEFRVMRAEAAADARAMRAEQSAQTSAIANAITATKQQAPQVILVPSPQVQPPPQQ